MNREVALRVCRADIRRFLSNPANLKLLLLLPVAIIGSLWPYIGSPFVPLLLMTFAGLEPQFNNILFRTNNEFEAMAVLSPDWRSVVLGKNLASIVMAIGTTLAAALVVGYFTPLTMGAEGWQDAGLFFVSVVFSLLSLGNLHSAQHPRRQVGLGPGDLAEAILMLLGLAFCSLPYLLFRQLEHRVLFIAAYSLLTAAFWWLRSIPHTAAIIGRERIRLCQTA